MEKLKRLLFEKTLESLKGYKYHLELYGEYNEFTSLLYDKFCVLYDLIESSGLEAEYQEWKLKQ